MHRFVRAHHAYAFMHIVPRVCTYVRYIRVPIVYVEIYGAVCERVREELARTLNADEGEGAVP